MITGSNLVEAEKGMAPGELAQVLLGDGRVSNNVENCRQGLDAVQPKR